MWDYFLVLDCLRSLALSHQLGEPSQAGDIYLPAFGT